MKDRLIILFAILGLLTCGENTFAQQNAEKHVLRKEAPASALARPIGKPAPTDSLRVAISLPLRNREALDELLKRLYDPGSPDYRHYLTPEQFTENFGPTKEDYQRVIDFAESFGLSVEQTHDNRLLLDVRGRVSDLERAFHVSLRTYQHPTEARQFRAPETQPWVDPKLPIQEVTGLSDYVLLRPTAQRKPVKTQSGAAGGSSPITGDFIGQDFRNAYAPGVSLTGAGQRVGLFEADGYYSADIENYEAYAGQSSVTLQNVTIDGFNGVPGALNTEVASDIEMAIAMAPGLAAVVVFECTNSVSGTNSGGTEVQYWLDTLDRMASSNQIKQFSSSWGYVTTDPTQDPNTAFDAEFKQMATQGQSFFQASGDGDAWATPIWVPADSPYVTSVGGTLLNMNGLGASFASETVWNSGYGPPGWPITDNNYWGSGGGVSTVYPIPYWQTNVSMTANLGSTTSRNIPDVALTATNIFITADNGEYGGYFGTSCSAPLWAGYNALINQQAANSNKPPVGFLNPAIYALGQGPNYSLCFHDTTTGSNTYPGSPTKYFATSGFDLCTGWGTPMGSNLINALAGVYQPTITTQPNTQTIGVGGGVTFTVAATGVTPFSYQWQFGGTNIASATQTSFSLANVVETNAGNYTVVVTNQWGSVTSSVAVLTVNSGTPVVTWANPAAITYGTALSGTQLNATANIPGAFVYTPASGTVLNAGTTSLTAVFTPTDTVDYSKTTNTVSLVVSPATLTITANNKSKTYGQAVTFAGTEFATSGLVNGNTVTSVTLASSGAAATAGVVGSPYSIVPSAAVGTGLANYNISYVNGSLTVSKAALSVTASAESKTYGQPVTFGSGSTLFTSSGLQNGETIGTVTLAVSGSGGAATASVSGSPYTITPSAATGGTFTANNYTVSYNPGSLTVNRATLTITASAESKIYGQTVTFGSGSTLFTSSGLQNGETVGSVTLAVSGSGGAATATVAGSPYTITSSSATGGTFIANNYTVSYNPGSLTVNHATLTITASAEIKTYGQTLTFGSGSTLFSSSGLQNGETIGTVTLGVSGNGGLATAPVASSPYAITPSVATGGTFVANNYLITYNPGNLTVNPAALTVTANNQSKTYGQAVSFGSGSALFASSALQNGETIGSVTLSVNNNGGAANAPVSGATYLITPSAATGGTFLPGNYSITYANGNLTVNPAALTVTANSRSKTYGQTVTFAGTEFTTSGLLNGDTVASATLSSSGTAATAGVVGSPYAIVPSAATGTGLGNYIISYNSGSLTVNQAGLTVTANSRSKTYGQTVSFAGTEFTTAGLLNGDTVTSASLSSSGASATAGVSGSPYAIVPSAATGTGLGNYTISYANGTLTINPATLSVTANNRTKTYGQTVTFAGTEFAAVGLLNSDNVGGVTLSSSGAAATATVGSPYAIVPSAATGTGLGNYTISYANGTLTINPATLSITANNRTKTYGQTVTFAGTEFAAVGLLNSDNVGRVTLSSSGAAATATVGSPYAIVPSAATGTGLGNYTISYANGTLTINPATLSITANNRSKTYGQTVSFAGTEFTSVGLVNSDSVGGVTLSSSGAAATAAVSGSPYAIVPSAATGTGLNNYIIGYSNGALTINPATLTITANNRSKTYGQTVTFAGTEFTSVGLVNSDTVSSVTLSSLGAGSSATVAGSPYAIVPSAAVGTGLGNYTIGYINGTLTVIGSGVTVTWNNPAAITYGAAISASQLNATASVPGTFVYTPTNNSVPNSGLNPLTVVFTPTDTVDYSSVTDTVSLVVQPAPLTVTAASYSRPYNTANPAFTGTINGLVNSDNITANYSSTATPTTPLGSYAITPILVDPNNRQTNYSVTLVNGALSIVQAAPVVTWTNPPPIIYGSALGGSQLNATANVTGTFTYTPTNGSVLNSGSNGLSVVFMPNDPVDYASATNNVGLMVGLANLTVTADSFDREFDTANPVFTGTIAGVVNGDNITATYASIATIDSPVGTYPITPTLVDPGNRETNYNVNLVNGLLVIGHPTEAFSWTTPTPIVYGTPLGANQLDASVNVIGTYAYSPTNGTVLNTGTNTLTVVFTPSDTVDYTGFTNSVNLVVTPAPLTITGAVTNRQYGQPNPVLMGTISGVTNGDNITDTFGCSATAASPVGSYAIVPGTAVGADLTNYTITYANGSLTVNSAVLSVTANNRAKTYGQAISFAGTEFLVSGLLNSDSVTKVTLVSSGAAAAAPVSGLPYAIVPSAAIGSGLANYAITYTNGNLTVNPAALTVTANNQSKTYGQALSFGSGSTLFTSSALQNGETIGSVTLSVNNNGGAANAPVSGATYLITPSAATGGTFLPGNYSITYANGNLTVNPAALTVTANSRSKTYGQTVTFAGTEFTTSGLLNGDTVASATLSSSGTAATAGVVGSPYAIVPSAATGTGLGNYTISYNSGSLTVNQAGLTVTANSRSKTYGQTVSFAGTEFTTAGLLNGDTVTSASLSSSGASATAGVSGSPYAIVPSAATGTGLGNYTISYANGTLTINPATLSVTANNRTKTYGQTVTFAGTEFAAVGLLNSDNVGGVTLSSSGAAATATVGSPYAIVPSAATGTGLGNYTISYANGTLTINPATLSITANNRTKTYGQTVTFAGTEFAAVGLLNSDNVGRVTLSSSGAAATATVGSPYAIVPSAATGTGLGNYTISYANGTLTINPATLSITANNRSKTYGQTVSFAGTEFTSVGLVNSDSVGGVTLSSSGAAATAAVSGSPYAIVPSAATGTGLNNYIIGYSNGALTINPATLTITANNRSKTYGQTVTFAGTEFTSVGLVNSDTVSSVTLSSLGAGSSATVAGSPYAIVPSAAVGTGLGNYTIGYINGTLTVIGSGVTVTWNNPAAITYGAAISASQLNATASVPGTFVYTPTNNSVPNSGLNPLTVVFTPTDTVDYSSVTDTVSLVVQPAPLTVTAASYSRPYNTANPAFTGTINGLVNSDNITANYSSTATVSSPVGTYPIVPSLVDPNNRRTNYTVSLVNGILVVGHPTEVNTWTNPAPIIYGTPLSSVQLNESVNVVGTYAYTPPAGTILNTGTNTLSVVFTPSDTIDYTSVTDSVSVVVLPAPLTIAAANATRQYGQANPVFVGTMTGVTNGDIITDTYASGASAASPVGTYTISPGSAAGSDLTNYLITYANGTLTVTPASLTVTANSRTKSYGQSASFAGTEFTTSGLLNGDAVSHVNLTSSGASPTATVVGSPYAIVPGAATGSGLGNYSITYANGALTVSPAELTITANNQTKTFGQTVNFAGTEFTASGLFNGDSVIGVSLVSAGSAATASVAGSPYVISASAANGSGLGNYTINYVGGRLTVLEASPIVSWANPNPIIYGTDLDTNELNASASVPGNFTYTPTNGTVLNSGSNVLSVLFTPSDPVDYTVVTATVSLTVLPAPLTVTADSFSRSFDADNPTFTGTISGLTNGDVISASYSCAADFGSPVGTYPIVPSLIDPGNRETNYSVNLVDGILVVGHPVEAFNWSNPASFVYGTPLSFAQLNASVNILGTYAYSPTNGTVLNTGTNALSVIFTPSDTLDYTSVTDTVSVVVTPAPLRIAGPTENRQYGQANPDLTGTITGLTNGDDITVTFTSSANSASPVGTYAIDPGLATDSDLTNYTISYTNGSLTVTPAPLNITAKNRTKVYGQGVTFLGTEFTATGLVNGDLVSSVSLSSSGAAANSLVAGSPYVITASAAIGTGLANYTIAYANGSLLISPAPLTITADNESKLQGQTFSFSGTEFAANGLVNGDTVTSVTLTSLGTPASANIAGSPYAIVPSAAEGVGLANYAISYVNGALTVSSGSQPVIQSATRSGDSIIFNWSTAASQSYQIQYTTNLSGNQWSDLGGPVTATNSSAAATVSITNSQTFYRLLLLP